MPRRCFSGGTPRKPAVEQLTPAIAAARLRKFLETRVGSTLLAWRRHLDRDGDRWIDNVEFAWHLKNLGFQGNSSAIFRAINIDKTDEICLDDIDPSQAALWHRFVSWSAQTFCGGADMMAKLAGSSVVEELSDSTFCSSLQSMCWDGQQEQLLFSALDVKGIGKITTDELQWVDVERRRRLRKLEAKRRALSENTWRDRRKDKARSLTNQFRTHLLRKHGNYLRAWRIALSPHDAMTINKSQFMKACAKTGFKSNSPLIWQMLDVDGSGTLSLDKLDMRSAELLASFHNFIMDKFGSATVAFDAIDRANVKQLRLTEFEKVLRQLGFERSEHEVKELFSGFDTNDSKSITEFDILFLDKWRMQPMLLATPNHDAMDEVKALLLEKSGSYLKAWRQLLDKDGSNRCSPAEFLAACQKLRYAGDIFGAWRALDADLSGYITLAELSLADHKYLMSFKSWADEEFGSTKNLFASIETEDAGLVTEQEFRRFLSMYGYRGSPAALIRALDKDVDKDVGAFSVEEIAFMDDWEPEECDDAAKQPAPFQSHQPELERQQTQRQQQQALQSPQHLGLLRWLQLAQHQHSLWSPRKRLARGQSQEICQRNSPRSSLRTDSCQSPVSLTLTRRETPQPRRHEAAGAYLLARPYPHPDDLLEPWNLPSRHTSQEAFCMGTLATSPRRARSDGVACRQLPRVPYPLPSPARSQCSATALATAPTCRHESKDEQELPCEWFSE